MTKQTNYLSDYREQNLSSISQSDLGILKSDLQTENNSELECPC
jgi:hypothetical protein